MRIGIMLRAWGERGGVGVYTRNLTRELLGLGSAHRFVLFWRRREEVGRHFPGHAGVEEHWVRGGPKPLWDQLAIPLACRRTGVDVLLHPKFTAPLLAPARAVMVVHGADWLLPDQRIFYPWWDVLYMRAFLPLYFRKCSRVISVSWRTTENFERVLRPARGKTETVYFGPAPGFRPLEDPALGRPIVERHGFPPRYLLTFSKATADRRKNLPTLLKAYARYHAGAEQPLPLVVVGEGGEELRRRHALPEVGWGRDVLFPGWIPQEDLPAIYAGAALLLYPSLLEAFPIPITEALACGTPIVTSDVNGLKELAEGAALLVDPRDPAAIAAGVERLLGDGALRERLRLQGIERSGDFSWRRCARRVLKILEEVGGSGEGGHGSAP
jgi:glycosyltransferase involved in cell wall biosynthesis